MFLDGENLKSGGTGPLCGCIELFVYEYNWCNVMADLGMHFSRA